MYKFDFSTQSTTLNVKYVEDGTSRILDFI